MYDVTAIGELLIDFAAVDADTSGYPLMKANPGGAPANFLAALNAYGAKTAFIGKVGDDSFGRLLLSTLREAGIDASGVRIDPAVFTTLAFVTFDRAGERSFSFARKPGADVMLRWDEVDTALIDDSRIFHFGTLSLTDEPSLSAVKSAVVYAKTAGKLISFDPNLRLPLWRDAGAAREQMLWGLSQADIVKISDEETEFLFGSCTPETAARRLLEEYGAALVMVTLGAEGCYLKNASASVRCGCPKVKPVDTTGAGDIFGGAAVSRLLRINKAPSALSEPELKELARFASAAASYSTQKQGGISSIVPECELI